MVLIVGGRSQGKLDFARSLFPGIKESEIGDGRTDSLPVLQSSKVLTHYEALVRRLLSRGDRTRLSGRTSTSKVCPEAVIISDEIGSGIIPLEPFEEEWRESTASPLCPGPTFRVILPGHLRNGTKGSNEGALPRLIVLAWRFSYPWRNGSFERGGLT